MAKKKTQTEPSAPAFSYIRFSSDKQEKGDSLRRQTEGTDEWCKRNEAVLDTSISMKALGVSAFRGKHRGDNAALGIFLKLVEDGRVPRGSFLIVENLDRLTREDIQPALLLVLNLLQAGVRIVQLKPVETIFDDKSEAMAVMLMIVELSRGHSESRMKSERLSSVWAERRKQTRENGAILTKRIPAWCKVKGDKLVIDQSRAAIVRRMFRWSIEGKGLALIVKQLMKEGVPTWGRGEAWSKAYVKKILTGKAVLGELQPIKHLKPDGEPIPDYFPAIIDEQTWTKAQAAIAGRKENPGRVGKNVASLFTGLLMDAETRTKMLVAKQTRGAGTDHPQRKKVLQCAASMEGHAPAISFPYDVFESAVLSCLREINPADVLGEEPEGESAILAGELATVERKLRQLEDEMTEGDDIPALSRVVKKLDESRRDLVNRLAQARQKESNPQAVVWGEMKTLLEVSEGEDNRLRLRGLLRNAIDSIWVLILPGIPKKSSRLAVVQIRFAGGDLRRDYVVQYWSAGNGRKGGWRVRSLTNIEAAGVRIGPLEPVDLETGMVWSNGEEHSIGIESVGAFYSSLDSEDFELIFSGSEIHPA